MPELAEVEVVRRNLVTWWEGDAASQVRVLDEKLLVDTDPATLVELLETPVQQIQRRGKCLIARWADGRAVVFHFRMTGKIIVADQPEIRFARLAWLVDRAGWLVFKDQRRLGHVQYFEAGQVDLLPFLATMGPEPYGLTAEALKARLPPGRTLKAALMDQTIIAGGGNIAISELFWRLKLPPKIKVSELTDDDFEALAREMPVYFDEVIAASMADEIVYLEERDAENLFDVYGREGQPCPRCQTPVEQMRVSGRSSYYCPSCQAR